MSQLRADYVRLDGLDVHHTYGGGGEPPVVFVHGLGSAGYMEWRFTLPVIGRRHAVYAPDLPGFGRSAKPKRGYGIPLFARVVERYLDRCLPPASRPVLVGASMGGRVVAEVALRRPERVAGLALVDALGVVRPRVNLLYALMILPQAGEAMVRITREVLHRASPSTIRRIARRLGNHDADRLLDDEHLAHLRELHADGDYARAYAATVRALSRPDSYLGSTSLLGRLAAAPLRVALIWGAKDSLLPVERVRGACLRLPGARLTVIDGAGHSPQADRPADFNRALEDFLAG
ncbi:MAG TPA: alpha/beta fold hydrolase [Candidatus Dormibacteraeota bacterium]|jgi:pimeloyl-ACP methyl ester carboxylesterase|nr:alpha/beta fold hydrolase [Candidatus Dormibacteraeota bacterium]